jgi:glycopeptide antibiotics resistance protein
MTLDNKIQVGKRSDKRVVKAGKLIFTIFYFTILFYLVFFIGRRRNGYSFDVNLVPVKNTWNNLKYIKEIGRFNYFSNIFGNILLFIPLPVVLKWHLKVFKFSTVLLTSLLLSISIESLQYIFNVGVADIDDVILNFVGGCAGYFIVFFWEKLRPN